MEEDRQRRIAEKAALNAKLQETHALNVRLAIIAREKREAARRAAARRAREKASRKKAAVNPLQALWDANGAAIYEANQAFKTKDGRNMSAKVRRKAIKDATRNGHFNAGAYAGNLVVKELERQVQIASSGGGSKPLYSPAKQDHDKNLASEENKPWVKDWHQSGVPLWSMNGNSSTSSITPTATPTSTHLPPLPTAIDLLSPNVDYGVTAPDLKSAALQALLRATNLPTAISRRTLIAMASAESGDKYHWDQEHEINGDNGVFYNSGILQVDKLDYRFKYGAPQPYNGYNNSATGYNNAVQDAVALLNDLSAGMADGTYTALDDAFTSLPNSNGDTARLLVYYNGGENDPIGTYQGKYWIELDDGTKQIIKGNRDYLGTVAYYLEASQFGPDYNDLLLAEDLYAAQEELDSLIDNP